MGESFNFNQFTQLKVPPTDKTETPIRFISLVQNRLHVVLMIITSENTGKQTACV